MKVVVTKASDRQHYAKCTVIKSLKGLEDFIKENGEIVIKPWKSEVYNYWEEAENKVKSEKFKAEYQIIIYDDYLE